MLTVYSSSWDEMRFDMLQRIVYSPDIEKL
jgi:hypothetical protein